MPQSIEEQVKNANSAYASGMPYLTDTEYDILWQQLHSLDPYNKNLYHTARDPRLGQDIYPHAYQIKGTNKAFNQDDLKPFLERFGNTHLVLEPKYDGCAAVLYRQEKGNFKLLLEGNGLAGRDISHHFKNMILNWTPKAIESVELIIPMKKWDQDFGANPRNTVAGWLSRSELPFNNVVEIISHSHNQFACHGYLYEGNLEKLSEVLLGLHTNWKEIYPIDGIMIKVADDKLRLTTDTHPTTYAWSLAWKPPIQTAETTVTDIEWNVSRNGRIIPTVIYDEVELCGTKNTRATGNNADWILERKLTKGSEIVVGKAGEIIPKILSVSSPEKALSYYPNFCPICGSGLLKLGKHLICESDKCLPQLTKSIQYFYSDKGMDLKSIGEFMIGDLLENPDLYSILVKNPWALLSPVSYNILWQIENIWGDKRSQTYLSNLEEIDNAKNLCHFIAALGLDGLAYKTTLKCYHAMKGFEIKSHIQKQALNNFAEAIVTFYTVNQKINFTFIPVPEPPKVIYCITGTLSSSRNDMITYLEKHNWQFSNQISKFVSILVVGDKPGKTKITKAQELSIKQIKEDDIINYIKEK